MLPLQEGSFFIKYTSTILNFRAIGTLESKEENKKRHNLRICFILKFQPF